MTEKRFTMMYGKYIDNENNIEYDEKWESWKICELLNELAEENEQLKQVAEKNKKLKQEIASENSILWNEILKLQKQGALPSNTFKNYLNDLKKEKKNKGGFAWLKNY